MGLGLRRVVLQYPWRGGRFRPESVAAFNRNQWQPSPGIGGRFRPESVATFARNTQWRAVCIERCMHGSVGGLRFLRVRGAYPTVHTSAATSGAAAHGTPRRTDGVAT